MSIFIRRCLPVIFSPMCICSLGLASEPLPDKEESHSYWVGHLDSTQNGLLAIGLKNSDASRQRSEDYTSLIVDLDRKQLVVRIADAFHPVFISGGERVLVLRGPDQLVEYDVATRKELSSRTLPRKEASVPSPSGDGFFRGPIADYAVLDKGNCIAFITPEHLCVAAKESDAIFSSYTPDLAHRFAGFQSLFAAANKAVLLTIEWPPASRVSDEKNQYDFKTWTPTTLRTASDWRLNAKSQSLLSAALSPDGNYAAALSVQYTDKGKRIRCDIWDAIRGAVLHGPLWEDDIGTLGLSLEGALAFSPDSSRIALQTSRSRLSIYSVKDGTLFKQLLNANAPVRAISFSPNGDKLFAGIDLSVIEWDNVLQDPSSPSPFATLSVAEFMSDHDTTSKNSQEQ